MTRGTEIGEILLADRAQGLLNLSRSGMFRNGL